MSNSIGDLKNSGLQGNNWPWQYKVLLGLDKIASLLVAGTEYESQLVKETCVGPPATSRILLEVRVWNTDTGTWGPTSYYTPGSSTPVPPPVPGPGCTLSYEDQNGLLAQILAELQSINAGIPAALGQTTMANSMPVTIASNQTSLPVTIDCTDKISLCVNGNTVDTGNPLPVSAQVSEADDSIVVYGFDGTDNQPISVDTNGNVNIRPLDCGDKVSVCFNDGVNDITVSTANPLPTTATVSFPTGSLTTCNDAVAITFCDTLLAEFIDQGLTLDAIQTAVEGTLDVNVTNTVTVQATDLDIRNLTFATDSVDVSGSNVNATVSGTVTATIDCSTSSIAICDGTGGPNLAINNSGGPSDGSINTVLVDFTTGATAVINPDGTQNNQIYAYDPSTLQAEALTSTPIGAVQALDVNQVSYARIPNIIISSGDPSFTVAVDVYSITFFNNGSTTVNVSMDGGATNAGIPAGVTVTMDAGGINNTYAANTFVVGSTVAAGASMIVTYNS